MKKITMIKINIVFAFTIVLLLGGCHPTPTREAVVNAGNLENEIASPAASAGAYDAPESWQEMLTVEGSDATIDIDAAISVPDVMAFPVYKVSKADFTTEQAQKLVNYFTKGKDVIKNKEQTKAELEELLIIAKKQLDEEWAAQLESLIETAPENVPEEIITNWDPVNSPSGRFISENGEEANLFVSPDSFYYSKGSIKTENVLLSRGKNQIGDIDISEEDAVMAAQNFLNKLDIKNTAACSMEKAVCFKSQKDAYSDTDEEPLSKGYYIKFARKLDGIAGIINEYVFVNIKDDFAYKAPFRPEEIQVYVDESGQPSLFAWYNKLKTGEKLAENVELLPFDEMKQRIRDMLTFINSYDSSPTKVTSVEMHMTIVNIKDNSAEAMYVPAWFIYYTKNYGNETQEYKLVLNAIDGGRVLESPVDIDTDLQQAADQQREEYNK